METKEQLYKKLQDKSLEIAKLQGQVSALILIINADDSKPNIPDITVEWNNGGNK